jgi:glycine dehydrogenase subunit 1
VRYIPNTSADRREMLDRVGADSVEDLFRDIPATVRKRFRPVGLDALSELELARRMAELARDNTAAGLVSFAGGGIYDHYVPAVVSNLVSRSEFVTAYTPYQPEISQGTLTAMFEFQTLVAELTGMEIANASLYDGATALAEAVLMAERVRGRRRVAVARALFPHLRRVLDTYAWAADVELVDVPYDASGRSATRKLPRDVSAVVLQSPNGFGVLESLDGLKQRIGEALLIVSAYPLSLGLLEPPGAFGADVVVGEGQSLGLPMGFGGPLLGLFATRSAYLRQLPGRVAGRTLDVKGATGYVMAAQTREQHIRRGRATSNICTNSAHCALSATVYLATIGADGLRQVASLCAARAHALARRIAEIDGFRLPFDGPFFNEFVVGTDEDPNDVRRRLREAGFLVDSPEALRAFGVDRALRIAVTERRTDDELDRFVAALGGTA